MSTLHPAMAKGNDKRLVTNKYLLQECVGGGEHLSAIFDVKNNLIDTQQQHKIINEKHKNRREIRFENT